MNKLFCNRNFQKKEKIFFCRFLVTKRVSHVLYIVKSFKQSDKEQEMIPMVY